ncbi:MAG: hypothetical protein P8X74_03565 [Reinekea sp.]
MLNEIVQASDIIKYLLGIIAFLGGCQIALIVWLWKKYVKQIDIDHVLLHDLLTEHRIFHRNQTGINRTE